MDNDYSHLIDKIENWDVLPKSPMVTIQMPTYNHEGYIKKALDSILMQQVDFTYEILLKDDKSTDKTRAIVTAYQKEHPDKIRLWLCKENLYSQGIKVGLSFFARGKYTAKLEGDDYWTDPLKLQKQVDFLEQNPQYSICFTYSVKVDTEGKPLETITNLQQQTFTQYDFLMGKKFQTRTQTILFNNQYLDVERIMRLNPKNRINGDTILKIQLTDNNKLGVRLPICTAAYRIHQGGVWSSLNKLNLTKKSYLSWRTKLKIAFKLNKKAFFPILYKSVELYFKWKMVTVLKTINK